jgi:hypothetical protein
VLMDIIGVYPPIGNFIDCLIFINIHF